MKRSLNLSLFGKLLTPCLLHFCKVKRHCQDSQRAGSWAPLPPCGPRPGCGCGFRQSRQARNWHSRRCTQARALSLPPILWLDVLLSLRRRPPGPLREGGDLVLPFCPALGTHHQPWVSSGVNSDSLTGVWLSLTLTARQAEPSPAVSMHQGHPLCLG